MRIYLSAVLLLVMSCTHSQSNQKKSPEIDPAETFIRDLGIDTAIAFNPKYRFQMVLTYGKEGVETETISWNTDKYYYPASLVKVPVAFVAMEKLERLGIPLDSYIVFDTVNACGSVKFVELSKRKNISIKTMFEEMIAVSDNHFYNVFYHFVTPKELNDRLYELGYTNTYIYRGFTGCEKEEHLRTYPWKIYSAKGELLASADATEMDPKILDEAYTQTEDRMFGAYHENEEGAIVKGPYDLNFTLEMPLEDIHNMMWRFFANNGQEESGWKISSSNSSFLYHLFGMWTNQIEKGSYRDLSDFEFDTYKYAIISDEKGRKLFSRGKLGLSYGFASETVFIQKPESNGGYLLTYSIYVNENDTVNDGKYEYEEVAKPFARELAMAIQKYVEEL